MDFTKRIAALPAPIRHGAAGFIAGFLSIVVKTVLEHKGVSTVDWFPETFWEAVDWGAVSAVSVPSVLALTNLTDAYGVGKKEPIIEDEIDVSPAPVDTVNHDPSVVDISVNQDDTPEGDFSDEEPGVGR